MPSTGLGMLVAKAAESLQADWGEHRCGDRILRYDELRAKRDSFNSAHGNSSKTCKDVASQGDQWYRPRSRRLVHMNFWRKLISGCQALSLDCRESSRAQSEALDHPLPPARRLGLWLHLMICQWCRCYGKQIRFLRETAHQHSEALAAADSQRLSGAAGERIKRRLQESK
jgi:hypothetical protein